MFEGLVLTCHRCLLLLECWRQKEMSEKTQNSGNVTRFEEQNEEKLLYEEGGGRMSSELEVIRGYCRAVSSTSVNLPSPPFFPGGNPFPTRGR